MGFVDKVKAAFKRGSKDDGSTTENGTTANQSAINKTRGAKASSKSAPVYPLGLIYYSPNDSGSVIIKYSLDGSESPGASEVLLMKFHDVNSLVPANRFNSKKEVVSSKFGATPKKYMEAVNSAIKQHAIKYKMEIELKNTKACEAIPIKLALLIDAKEPGRGRILELSKDGDRCNEMTSCLAIATVAYYNKDLPARITMSPSVFVRKSASNTNVATLPCT